MSRSTPISVEELLRKKKEEANAQKQPRFLTKAQREALKAASSSTAKVTKSASSSIINKPRLPKPIEDKQNEKPIRKQKKAPSQQRHDKFRFDWGENEDTLDKNDPLYALASTSSTITNSRNEYNNPRNSKASNGAIDWDDVHWSKKPIEKMKERDWRIFREDFSIAIKGAVISSKSDEDNKNAKKTAPKPIRYWKESSIPSQILDIVHELRYSQPTPIQRAAIPFALAGRDVIGVAETGSGKTASFVIPLLATILDIQQSNYEYNAKNDGPLAVILAPTRELAQQIEGETMKFCTPLGLRCSSIVGGHALEEQVHYLQHGVEIIIATPGRLVDLIERKAIALGECRYVVLDEADRMIDLGFEDQVNAILSALPKTTMASGSTRQTMMYTATWPRAIERLAENYLRHPAIVTIGTAGQATDRVEQRVMFIQSEERRAETLCTILRNGLPSNSNSLPDSEKSGRSDSHRRNRSNQNDLPFPPPIIVFVNYKRTCDFVVKKLNSEGWRTAVMHGSRSQEQREAALASLRDGHSSILVATDVAGRGIDVPNVSLVVNFQMAKNIEDYTHRIGRTGRAGKYGVAVTFLGRDEDVNVLTDLKSMIEKSPISKVPDELRRLTVKKF